MNIFPFFSEESTPVLGRGLPLMREVARDMNTGKTVWRGGNPVIVSGVEAVASWAMAALRTVRCRHDIYSTQFGCDAMTLMGRAWSEDVKSVEAPRMVRDALTASPYVTGVDDLTVEFADGRLVISGRLNTIYGEVRLDVSDL